MKKYFRGELEYWWLMSKEQTEEEKKKKRSCINWPADEAQRQRWLKRSEKLLWVGGKDRKLRKE